MTKIGRPRAGERVVLVSIPPGLLDGLPDDDQRAITAIVGKPVRFCGYDDIGRAELEFDDPLDDSIHTIWVKPEFIDRRTTVARAKHPRMKSKGKTRRGNRKVARSRRRSG